MVFIILSFPVFQPVDARACGMGGSYTWLSDGIWGYYWNPGGIVFGDGGYGFYYDDYGGVSGLNVVGLGFKSMVGGMGMAGGWLRVHTGLYSGDYTLPDTSGMSEDMFSIGISGKVGRDMGVGVVLQRYRVSSFYGGASGMGFDVGVRYISTVSFGFVVHNILASFGSVSCPMIYRFGVGWSGLPKERIVIRIKDGKRYRVKERYGYRLAGGIDVEYRSYEVRETERGWGEGKFYIYSGVEYAPVDMFGLRFGFSTMEGVVGGLRVGYGGYFIDFSYSQGNIATGNRIRINFIVKR